MRNVESLVKTGWKIYGKFMDFVILLIEHLFYYFLSLNLFLYISKRELYSKV